MRLLILSDLHRDIWRAGTAKAATRLDPVLEVSRPDVVILAGDIEEGHRAVAWADQTFSGIPVAYVSGNHEGYGRSLDSVQEEIAAACLETSNVHYLNRREIILEGVRFLGATLWTDFNLLGDEHRQIALYDAASELNDYRRIRVAASGYRRLRPADTLRYHQQDRSWLEARLAESFSGKTVVVTHMAPSERSIPDRYKGDPLSAAFASNLESLVMQTDLWVHGHVHDSADYRIGRGRVVCNPLGYPVPRPEQGVRPENPDFDPNFIIEV